jgi:hypothetical protein
MNRNQRIRIAEAAAREPTEKRVDAALAAISEGESADKMNPREGEPT